MDECVGHVGAIGYGLFVEMEGGKVGALGLKVGLEHDYGVLSSEVGLPGVGVLDGHQVDFVQNEDDLLVGVAQDLALDVLAAAGKRVPRVQHLQNDVAVLYDLFDFFEVLAVLLEVPSLRQLVALLLAGCTFLELVLLHEMSNVRQLLPLKILHHLIPAGLLVFQRLDHFVLERGEGRRFV